MSKNTFFKLSIWFCLSVTGIYGVGRVYYYVTDGFTTSNIASNLKFDPRFETKSITTEEKNLVDSILSQKFEYLGKGCQSYVFASEDGRYVLKFFKYQRFTPQEWLNLFSFIPTMNEYRLLKIEKKRNKLENIFKSWKIAHDELKSETGLVYVHLNKTNTLQKQVLIADKVGMEHHLAIDDYEFLIQKRAFMLTDTIENQMKMSQLDQTKKLLDTLFDTLVSEYKRGLGDNDHALMQNTGVLDGMPIHIDVGQFLQKESYKNVEVQAQEMFNKTYKFRIWLKKSFPDLSLYFDEKLYTFIGPKMDELRPQLKNMDGNDF